MQFSCTNVTSGQTRILSSPDHNGTIVCSINNPTTNCAITSSNGIQRMWNQITTSIIGDFSLSNIAQKDATQVNLSTVNSITTSTGVYYFQTNNIM